MVMNVMQGKHVVNAMGQESARRVATSQTAFSSCALRKTFNGLVCDFAPLSCAGLSESDILQSLHGT
jgi:hypothetical protein